jgi:hypothetical protein
MLNCILGITALLVLPRFPSEVLRGVSYGSATEPTAIHRPGWPLLVQGLGSQQSHAEPSNGVVFSIVFTLLIFSPEFSLLQLKSKSE